MRWCCFSDVLLLLLFRVVAVVASTLFFGFGLWRSSLSLSLSLSMWEMLFISPIINITSTMSIPSAFTHMPLEGSSVVEDSPSFSPSLLFFFPHSLPEPCCVKKVKDGTKPQICLPSRSLYQFSSPPTWTVLQVVSRGNSEKSSSCYSKFNSSINEIARFDLG